MALNDAVTFDFKKAGKQIEALYKTGPDAAVSGLRIIGEEIVADVRTSGPGRGVPKDEGILAATLRALGPDNLGIVKLRAGGASAPYALAQHERTDYSHAVGEARYWIRGMDRWANGESSDPAKRMAEIAEKAIRDARLKAGA